jgi:hypothetical protein
VKLENGREIPSPVVIHTVRGPGVADGWIMTSASTVESLASIISDEIPEPLNVICVAPAKRIPVISTNSSAPGDADAGIMLVIDGRGIETTVMGVTGCHST